MSAQETATSGLGASPPPPWAQRMAPTLYKLGVAKGAEAAGAILLIALGVAWLVFALMLFANKGVGFGTIIYAIVGLALSVWLLRILTDGRKLVIALPMAWLLLFFHWDAIFTEGRQDKKVYADESSLLIDDTIYNIEDWKKSGGYGIYHTSHKNTINYLYDLELL